MHRIVLIALFDAHGRLLMQERDSDAPTNPDQWTIIGGSVEADETPEDAARRELAEETGLSCDELKHVGQYEAPCTVHGQDLADLFCGYTDATDADIVCGEGRQIIFVEPHIVRTLDLTQLSQALLPKVLHHA